MSNIVFVSQGPDHEASSAPFRLLRNYAKLDPGLNQTCNFSHVTVPALPIHDTSFAPIAVSLAENLSAMAPDLLALSLYCWNTSTLLELAHYLRQLRPEVVVVAGGPDTDGRGPQLLQAHPQLDYVISGEGEVAFRMLLEHLFGPDEPPDAPRKSLPVFGAPGGLMDIPFLSFREADTVKTSRNRAFVQELDTIPSPIVGVPAKDLETRFQRSETPAVIVETSRGCPVNCAFCQFPKSNGGKMRYFSVERVLAELRHIRDVGIKSVYFGDGILTLRKERAQRIFDFFLNEFPNGILHTEIKLDILPEALWPQVRKLLEQGRMSLGIGVQSVNLQTLKRMGRTTRFGRLETVLPALSTGAMRMRWDLIYGLPGDRFEDFIEGFEYINRVTPGAVIATQRLQVLPGTRYRTASREFGLVFESANPYLAVCSDTFGPEDMMRAKLFVKVYEIVQMALRAAHQQLGSLAGLYREVFCDEPFNVRVGHEQAVFHRLLWKLRDALLARAKAHGHPADPLNDCYEWTVVRWLESSPVIAAHPMWGDFDEFRTLVRPLDTEQEQLDPGLPIQVRPLLRCGRLFRFYRDFDERDSSEPVYKFLLGSRSSTMTASLFEAVSQLSEPRTPRQLHTALAAADPGWKNVSDQELCEALEDCLRDGLLLRPHPPQAPSAHSCAAPSTAATRLV